VHSDTAATLTAAELAADLAAAGVHGDEHRQLAAAVRARLVELGDLGAAEALSMALDQRTPPRPPRRAA
jgi:hypothetical protein